MLERHVLAPPVPVAARLLLLLLAAPTQPSSQATHIDPRASTGSPAAPCLWQSFSAKWTCPTCCGEQHHCMCHLWAIGGVARPLIAPMPCGVPCGVSYSLTFSVCAVNHAQKPARNTRLVNRSVTPPPGSNGTTDIAARAAPASPLHATKLTHGCYAAGARWAELYLHT